MTQLKSNRPKNYQPIKEVLSYIEDLSTGTRFKLISIDGHYLATFVKFENKVLHYRLTNIVTTDGKIKKVALHRIKFIM